MQLHELLRKMDKLDLKWEALHKEQTKFMESRGALINNIKVSKELQLRCEELEDRVGRLEGNLEADTITLHSTGYNTDINNDLSANSIIRQVFTQLKYTDDFLETALQKTQLMGVSRVAEEKLTKMQALGKELTKEFYVVLKNFDIDVVETAMEQSDKPKKTGPPSISESVAAFTPENIMDSSINTAQDPTTSKSATTIKTAVSKASTAISKDSFNNTQYTELPDATQYSQVQSNP